MKVDKKIINISSPSLSDYKIWREFHYNYHTNSEHHVLCEFYTVMFNILNWPYNEDGHWTGIAMEFKVPQKYLK